MHCTKHICKQHVATWLAKTVQFQSKSFEKAYEYLEWIQSETRLLGCVLKWGWFLLSMQAGRLWGIGEGGGSRIGGKADIAWAAEMDLFHFF